MRQHSAFGLAAYDTESGALNVVVETPQGSRNKFAFDPPSGLFRLKVVLPEGAAFPHAFGFVPSTRSDDGDPLDVMVLMDGPAYPGSLVPSRLLGVIQARQTNADGQLVENDRLLAVACDAHTHADVAHPRDLPRNFVTEVEDFFVFYNKARGMQFEPVGWKGPRAAKRLVATGEQRHAKRSP